MAVSNRGARVDIGTVVCVSGSVVAIGIVIDVVSSVMVGFIGVAVESDLMYRSADGYCIV